jgi:hypothetical protein
MRSSKFYSVLIIAALTSAAIFPAGAAELYSSDGFEIRWDNTLRYSTAFRLTPAEDALVAKANNDDGDRDFAPGIISNRLDLLSEFDISRGDFGVHASIAAWYDTVYHARTDNNSPATYNPDSAPNTEFARPVRNLMGQYIDLTDTFAYGNFALGGAPASLRVGRQTLLWGESLFFDENGIAAAQAPIDHIKNISAPDGYAQDVFLPVDQVSLTVQPLSNISLSAYYQFDWRASRFPGVGSYFSYLDYLGAGGERLIYAPGEYLYHGRDYAPPSGGQFGTSLHTTLDDIDFGAYALRYNAKDPILRLVPGAIGSSHPGYYDFVYPTGIDLYGVSFSTYAGNDNIAGELSVRRHMPLVSNTSASAYYFGQQSSFIGHSGYAEGDTLHTQLSSVTTLPPSSVWDSANLSIEIAANDVLSVTQSPQMLDPARDRFAMSGRALFEPHYFEVMPNLDIMIPLGFGYNIAGRSSIDYTENPGAGDFEAGVSATYLSVWKASFTVTSFIGSPSAQPLADRDFVSFSIERTF